MHGNIPFGVASATEIHRQECVQPRKIAVRNFPRVAKLLWPDKTAATLASLVHDYTGDQVSPRTVERWVSGEIDPPFCVIHFTMFEIFGRRE